MAPYSEIRSRSFTAVLPPLCWGAALIVASALYPGHVHPTCLALLPALIILSVGRVLSGSISRICSIIGCGALGLWLMGVAINNYSGMGPGETEYAFDWPGMLLDLASVIAPVLAYSISGGGKSGSTDNTDAEWTLHWDFLPVLPAALFIAQPHTASHVWLLISLCYLVLIRLSARGAKPRPEWAVPLLAVCLVELGGTTLLVPRIGFAVLAVIGARAMKLLPLNSEVENRGSLPERLRYPWIICGIALAVRAFMHLSTRMAWDDAYITYRYARNLAEGFGPVFNPGEHVLGTTSALWMLLLAFVQKLTGLAPHLTGPWMGILLSVGTIWVVMRIIDSEGLGRIAPWVGLALALNGRMALNSFSGMETPLFMLLQALALKDLLGRAPAWRTGLISALVMMARLDGALFLIPAWLFTWWKRKEFPLAELLLALLFYAPWGVFAYLYYGSFIPVSMQGKLEFFRIYYRRAQGELYSLLWGSWTGRAGVLLFAAGIAAAVRRRALGLLAGMVYPLVHYGAFVLMKVGELFPWYLVPPGPWLALGGVLGAETFLRRRTTGSLVAAGMSLIVLAQLPGLWERHSAARNYMKEAKAGYFAVVDCVNENTSPDDLLCLEEIGHIGYFTNRRVLDWGALVTPGAADYLRDGQNIRDFLIDHDPDYLIFPVAAGGERILEPLTIGRDPSDFQPEYYQLVKRFEYQKERKRDRHDYLILRRKGNSLPENIPRRDEIRPTPP